MRTLLLLLFIGSCFAQNPTVTATRIIRGVGAPPASRCDQAGEVSNVYVQFDSESTASPLYICTQISAGMYDWVASGTGGAAATVPFSGVTAGTNTAALVLGTGGTLTTTGTGRNTANAVSSDTAPPSNCTTGDMFFETDTPNGQQLLGCTATNTWTAMSGRNDLVFTIDGGGAAISTGDVNFFPVANANCTIDGYKVTAYPSGSLTMAVWKRAGAIPTAAQAISGAAPVTLSSSQLNLSGDASSWTDKNVLVNDVMGFNISVATDVERVVITIGCLTSFASA